MNKLQQAARRAVLQALRLRRTDRFLLITDRSKIDIAEALAFWARRSGAETTTYLMTETLRPIIKPTGLLQDLVKKATAVAYVLDARIAEKPFRGFLVKAGVAHGRICMMPGLTREMMERLVNIDFGDMARLTKRVVASLQDAREVAVENPQGTRLSFSVRGRQWKQDTGDISRRGQHGNLPAGECFTAPVEETFTGKLVLSLIDDRLGRGVMEFEKGRLVRSSGKGVAAVVKNIGRDPSGLTIGEFGIGTNRKARVCPRMLEAEKAFGTAHFAIGDSYGLGKNKSRHHYDALVEKVTIRADGKTILRNGKFFL